MAQDETRNPARNEDPQPHGPPENRAAQLGLGLFFGVIFGFLLQKGGVAKYEVLIGELGEDHVFLSTHEAMAALTDKPPT